MNISGGGRKPAVLLCQIVFIKLNLVGSVFNVTHYSVHRTSNILSYQTSIAVLSLPPKDLSQIGPIRRDVR